MRRQRRKDARMKPAQRKLFWSGAAWAARQRYTDLEVVGSGANAVVVRATDGLTGRPVAIKRISAVFFAPEEAIRVLREVRLLSHFTHPNVLSLKTLIYPKDPSAFDTVFIVTEYCETDLRQLLAFSSSLPPAQVRSFLAQLLAALHYVHSLRAIHRDLKPANILISDARRSPSAPYGLLRLCDFGLARVDLGAEGTTPRMPSPLRLARSRKELAAGAEADEVWAGGVMGGDGDDAEMATSRSCEDGPGQTSRSWASADEETPRDTAAAAELLRASSPVMGLAVASAAAPPLRHQLTTKGVTTRWYRAPEVILEEPYTTKIDLWAVGCIAKELIELTRDRSATCPTGALFPGYDDCLSAAPSGSTCADTVDHSTGPDASSWAAAGVAAASEGVRDAAGEVQDERRTDQLSVIIRGLGTPNAEEFSWASPSSRELVLASLPGERWSTLRASEREAQLSACLLRKLPGAAEDELALLRALLSLAPSPRPSAEEALRMPYFAPLPLVQRPQLDDHNAASAHAIIDSAFSFEAGQMGCAQIRSLLSEDIERMAALDSAATGQDVTGGTTLRTPTKKSFAEASQECMAHLHSALDECLQTRTFAARPPEFTRVETHGEQTVTA